MAMDSNHRISMNGSRCNCMVAEGRYYQWGRSVKRKREDAGFGPRGDSSDAEMEREAEDDVMTLRETLRSQHQALEKLASELEEERNASAIAATETMSMILRLQKEKAEVQMEASQFRRFAEGKFAHDQQELTDLENLLYRKDQVIQALECEVQSYKHRLLSIGFVEFENERTRSPEGFQPDYKEDCFCSWDRCASRSRPFAEKLDGIDSNDEETRDSAQKRDKEAGGRHTCLNKPDEAAISRQSQQECEDSFYLEIMRGQDIGYSTCHGLQPGESSPTYQGKDCNLKVRQGYNNSETDDAQNIAIKAIEKTLADDNLTLWKCIEKLDDKLQVLEKVLRNHHLDNEWIATRKVLQKKLASYSASLREGTISYKRLSTDGAGMPDGTKREADEDNSGEIDFLSSINVNGKVSEVGKINGNISFPGRAAVMLPTVDGTAEQKSTLNGASEAQNGNTSTRGCKSLKGNRNWMNEPDSPSRRHEGCGSGGAPDLTERKGERNTALMNDPEISLHHDRQLSRTAHGVDNPAVLPMDLDNEQTATKVFKQNLTSYSSSLREGLKSHQRLSTERTGISFGVTKVDNGVSENCDGLPSAEFKGKQMPELLNTGVNLSCSGNKATAALPVDDMTNRQSNTDDVFENQSSNSSSKGFKLLEGERNEGDAVCRETDLTEMKTGRNKTQASEQVASLSVKLKAEPAVDEDELRQLSLKLKELERERDSMKQAIQTLRREKAHLALLKEIAQQLHELQSPDQNQKDAKMISLQEGVSILSIIKWILSYIFRRNKRIRQSKYKCGVSHNNVGLLFLLDDAPKRQVGTCITRIGM